MAIQLVYLWFKLRDHCQSRAPQNRNNEQSTSLPDFIPMEATRLGSVGRSDWRKWERRRVRAMCEGGQTLPSPVLLLLPVLD